MFNIISSLVLDKFSGPQLLQFMKSFQFHVSVMFKQQQK